MTYDPNQKRGGPANPGNWSKYENSNPERPLPEAGRRREEVEYATNDYVTAAEKSAYSPHQLSRPRHPDDMRRIEVLVDFHTAAQMASQRILFDAVTNDGLVTDRVAGWRKSEWVRPNGRLKLSRVLNVPARRREDARVDASFEPGRQRAAEGRKAEHQARLDRLQHHMEADDLHGFQWERYGAGDFSY